MTTRAINFNAGPATLPLPALERAREELLDFAGTGMSVMEHSHRGKEYEAVHDEAISLLREVYGVPESHEILFLQGGASGLFAQIPLNLLSPGASADYVVNGAWGEKAFSEAQVTAKLIGAGTVRLAHSTGTGAEKNKSYTRASRVDEMEVDAKSTYLHVTSNETIHGLQMMDLPDPARVKGVPVICDMSSDFMWRRADVGKVALTYAGAQKNLGPSGIVVVLADKALIERGRKDIPVIWQLRTAAANKSLYNTPPTFAIYLVRNVLAWIKERGGLERVEADNLEKARRLYGVIDAHADVFRCPVEQGSRSAMNVVFRLKDEAAESAFVAAAKKERMIGLKGHRSVGGIRVSLYNAVSLEWVDQLTDFMKKWVTSSST